MAALALKARPRQWVTKLHRWSGLLLALFLLIAALTGALMAFRWEVDAWLNPELFAVQPGARHAPQTEIIQQVEARFPDARVGTLVYPVRPDRALRISLMDKHAPAGMGHGMGHGQGGNLQFNQVFVDPYSGHILGQRNTRQISFDRPGLMPFLVRLHFSLWLDQAGVWWMGGVAVVWLLTSFLGLALSWPRAWRRWRQGWRDMLALRTGQGSYKLHYDLHRAASVATLPLMLVLAFTSVYLNLPDLVKPAVGWFSPLSVPPKLEGQPKAEAPISPEQALAAAAHILPDGRVSSLGPDVRRGLYNLRVYVPGDVSPSGNHMLALGMADGAPVGLRRTDTGSAGDVLLAWMFPLHSGLAFGVVGQALVLGLGLVLTAVCWTGLVVWGRKQRGERRLAARQREAAAQGGLNPCTARLRTDP